MCAAIDDGQHAVQLGQLWNKQLARDKYRQIDAYKKDQAVRVAHWYSRKRQVVHEASIALLRKLYRKVTQGLMPAEPCPVLEIEVRVSHVLRTHSRASENG